MVSKRYFRAAAAAWMEAQTCFEFVQEHVSRVLYGRFPPIAHHLGDTGLFQEFGRAFVTNLATPLSPHESQQMFLCRRMQYLIFVVDEDFFCETDRGFAWEVEFTDEELLDSLKRANFSLPSSVVDQKVRIHKDLKYANTAEKEVVFSANAVRLGHVMQAHKSTKPLADTANHGHGASYLGSKVTSTPSVEKKTPELVDKGKRSKVTSTPSAEKEMPELLDKPKHYKLIQRHQEYWR